MKARLVESRELAPLVRHLVFEVPELAVFSFVPGQFVSFQETLRGLSITRAYSIASPPAGNRFELCLNLVRDGHFSPHLFRMQPGDTVEMTGPVGTFGFRELPRDSLLVATGTGIAPLRSMLHTRLPEDAAHQYTLLFGARFEKGLLYRDEFEALARQHSHFHFWPTLTRPEPGSPCRTGRVQAHLHEALGGRTGLSVYLCGLKAMVDDVRTMLKSMGFDRKQIIYEKYD